MADDVGSDELAAFPDTDLGKSEMAFGVSAAEGAEVADSQET